MGIPKLLGILWSIQVTVNAQAWEYYKGNYFLFSSQTANHNDAKSACIGQGGHLAIIPDAETQAFIKNTGIAYKTAGRWMTSNFIAYIDAVITADKTGWEWSSTGVKFYFKTTYRGSGGPKIENGQYNNWHIYQPNGLFNNYAVVNSDYGGYSWHWGTVPSSTVSHYICQTEAWEYYKGSYFMFSPQTANHSDAKSACIGQGGQLAIIPDAETQAFIKNTGSTYKTKGKWMSSNSEAYIDAVKTSDGTGWEWSTTGVKFYFKTTQRGPGGPYIENGKYNSWNIYQPGGSSHDYAVVESNYGSYSWQWKSVSSSDVAHYICQAEVKSTKLIVSNSMLNVKHGVDYVDCKPNLYPAPPLSWIRNSQPVSTNTSDRIYQTTAKTFWQNNLGTRLYFTRGLAQDSGTYTCNATSLTQSAVITVTIDKKARVYATKLTTSSYTCKFIGDSTPSVYWKINDITINKEVAFVTTTMLNQHEVSSEISNLLFGTGDVVSCWASNSYGSSDMASQSAFADLPSISATAAPGACPGSQLQINWTDLTKSKGNITYSMSVYSGDYAKLKYFSQNSTSDNRYSTTLDNLVPRTSYVVEIRLFPEYSKKVERLYPSTAGVKPSVSFANISLGFDKKSCSLSWGDGGTPGVIGSRITVTSSVYKTAGESIYNITQSVHDAPWYSYTFQTKANRKHNVIVAAKTCSEVGLAVVAIGQCISPVQAPPVIAIPIVLGDSTHTSYLSITKPDESNGPISCYVVIGYKGPSIRRPDHTWLQITNITNNKDPSIYCVATLPRFNETRKQVKLSSSDTTQCSLGSSDFINCTNKPMTNGQTYIFQVVSITSADGVYLTQSSRAIVTNPIKAENTLIIAIAVVSSFLVLVSIAAGYFYHKTRLQPATVPVKNLAQTEGDYEVMEIGKIAK